MQDRDALTPFMAMSGQRTETAWRNTEDHLFSCPPQAVYIICTARYIVNFDLNLLPQKIYCIIS
jgi:hypothetical protein